MSGSYYIALSGMRTRLDELDRVASDIANASTTGYKAERATTAQADRPSFDATLQSAIDVSPGATRVDFRPGSITPSGRELDLAIDGSGFFEIDTAAGLRYTRDGRFMRRSDGLLATPEGDPVQGAGGSIRLPPKGDVRVDADGTIRVGAAVVGTLKVVDFDSTAGLVREGASRFRAPGLTPGPAERAAIRSGALEQSNVSVVDRISELTAGMRNFETLQKAISVMANDIDGRTATELGRR